MRRWSDGQEMVVLPTNLFQAMMVALESYEDSLPKEPPLNNSIEGNSIHRLLDIRVIHDIETDLYTADAYVLPGSPPTGLGRSVEEAKFDLLAKIIIEWHTWGRFIPLKASARTAVKEI